LANLLGCLGGGGGFVRVFRTRGARSLRRMREEERRIRGSRIFSWSINLLRFHLVLSLLARFIKRLSIHNN